jgi:hypothetical protein
MIEREIITVESIAVEPSEGCSLSAPLLVRLRYRLNEPVAAARWRIVYEADFINRRVIIPLYSAPESDLSPGVHTLEHRVAEVPIAGVKEKYLLQVGLLKLEFNGAEGNLASVNLVTQVSRDPSTGTILRNIMSPLE